MLDDDPHTVAMRARAAALAGYLEDHGTLAAARDDPDPWIRSLAVGAAARRGRRSVAERLRDLRDTAPEVRRRACQLEARSPRPSTKVAVELAERLGDPDPLVVVAACEALGERADPAAVPPLASVAGHHDDARCREAAVAALGAIGAPEGLEAVLGALGDRPAVRRRAVVALAAFEDPRVEASLATALEDRDWQVREVARALLEAARPD